MKKYTPAHYEKVKAIQGKKFYCPKHRQFRWKSDGTCSDCKRLEKRMAYVVQWLKDHDKWPHDTTPPSPASVLEVGKCQ